MTPMTEENSSFRPDSLDILKADIIGSEWLFLVKKPERTFDEQNLKDRLKRILIASGWQEELLDRLATEYKAAGKADESEHT